MSRIKAVLNERRLAYEGAFQIAHQESDNAKLELEQKLERLADPIERKKAQMWKNRDQKSIKKTQTAQRSASKGGRPNRYDGEDHRILRIQRPGGIQTTKSKFLRESSKTAHRNWAPKKPANPWVNSSSIRKLQSAPDRARGAGEEGGAKARRSETQASPSQKLISRHHLSASEMLGTTWTGLSYKYSTNIN